MSTHDSVTAILGPAVVEHLTPVLLEGTCMLHGMSPRRLQVQPSPAKNVADLICQVGTAACMLPSCSFPVGPLFGVLHLLLCWLILATLWI